MTTEREEALELAREAGFDELQGWRDNNEIDYYFEGWPEHVEKLVRLAKQRGAEELYAANARIAELEDAVRRNGIKVSAPLGSLLSPHDITAPSQPTTLPE